MAATSDRRRILVVTRTDLGCYRELVQGICSYANTEGRWQLQICPPDFSPVRVIESTRPDGLLLGLMVDPEVNRRAVQLVPATVAVCRGYVDPDHRLPAVESDDPAVGRMGAEYLLSKGFGHFVFIGQVDSPWSQLRYEGFRSALIGTGHSADKVDINWGTTLKDPVQKKLTELLRTTPKPLAVLACNDGSARVIGQFCLDLGLRVPEDVAILGVDDDDLSTAIANPPLSSIAIPWQSMGRKASTLLDRLIDGKTVEPGVQLLSPTRVVERQSTGGVAIADEQVRTAVRFIREHAGSRISVDDIAESAGINRRSLERKFRETLGQSPLEELRRCRVDLAQLLLSQTELTIKQVAHRTGFGSLSWFTTAFRDLTRHSPAKYRQIARQR